MSVKMDHGEWVLAEGKSQGRPMLVRFRRFTEALKRKYPERIDITWNIAKPDLHGLPSEKEMDRMASFENLLVEAVEHDDHSVLAFTITTNGERRFMFHTTDVGGFMERLQNLPHPHGRYPISLECDEDPEWSYYGKFAI